jgi:hypothetical protein
VYRSNRSVYRTKPTELQMLILNLNSTVFGLFPVEPVLYTTTGPRQFGLTGWEKNPGRTAAGRASARGNRGIGGGRYLPSAPGVIRISDRQRAAGSELAKVSGKPCTASFFAGILYIFRKIVMSLDYNSLEVQQYPTQSNNIKP